MELKGKNFLQNKLEQKRIRVLTRYKYYEMKQDMHYISRLIPESYKWMSECLGWCTKAVDSLANRLSFNEFRNDNFDFNGIFALNNPDVLFDSAMLSALISSCSFIYIFEDENEEVKLQVIDGANATGVIDETTGLLTEGYAVLERDEWDNVTLSAYFTPGEVTYYRDGKQIETISNAAKYCSLVPIIFRPDAKRKFGHSRISRACMNLMDEALEELLRTRVSSEFYAFPQKYIIGLSEDAEFNNKLATYSNFLALYKDEDGANPTIGQFSASSMAPHIEYIKTLAAQFASETGLTLDDLGFVTANPSTAEAIKASYENLRLIASKAQRTFGSGFINAGYIAASIRDDFSYERSEVYETKCAWNPMFIPDASALSGIGDGIIKLEQSKPGYVTDEKMYDLVGF